MLFSVITVVLNCADTIKRTIQSVLSQKNSDIEYIIVDGGSSDGTLEIIKHYKEKIDFVISEFDEGIYYAMNKGINKATGEWISFINGNDWYEDDAFYIVRKAIDKTDKKIIYGKVNLIKDGIKQGYAGIEFYENPDKIHYTNLYCHQGMFIKKELFKILGLYKTNYKVYADYEWNLNAHCNGYDPLFIDYPIANFTYGGLSTSQWESYETLNIISEYALSLKINNINVKRNIGKAEYNIIKKIELSYIRPFFIQFDKYFVWGIGNYGKEILDIMKALGISVIGFIDSFANITEKWGVKVYRPDEILMNQQAENCGIFIATELYEDEIVATIRKSHYHTNSYVSLTQLYTWLFNKTNDFQRFLYE